MQKKDPDGKHRWLYNHNSETTKNKWRPPFTPRKGSSSTMVKGIDAKMSLIKKALELGVIERPTSRSYRLPFESR